MERDPLALTPSEMRELGHRAVGLLADGLGGWSDPPIQRPDPGVLERLLVEPAPDEPR